MLDNIKQKLKDAPNKARDALKRAVIRTRRRSAAFRRAGGMRRVMDNLVDGVRNKQPRALITLGSAAAAVIAVAVIIISGGGKAAAQGEITNFLLPEDAVNIAAAMTPTPEATYAAPTPEPTPTPVSMGKGATGAQVKAVQERLMELGYMDYDEPTEKYGSVTKEAVEVFQRRHGLTVDGYIGEETYDRLMRADALPYMATVGDEGTDIEELQKRLVELDYMKKATGYFGDETAAAVKEFQDRNHLDVDGMIGVNTKEALYSEDAIPHSLSYGEKSDDVLKYQNRLFKLGYLTTEPDGTFGKRGKAFPAAKRPYCGRTHRPADEEAAYVLRCTGERAYDRYERGHG